MKTNFINVRNIVLAGITLFWIGSGCNNSKQPATDQEEQKNDSILPKEELVEEVIEYPLPTSFEITKMINKAKIGYTFGITNSAKNINKYFTEKQKALNLGIYGADLSYASTYFERNETMQFLDVCKKLINDIEITTAFNKTFAQRVEQNIENKDSLINIISDSFYDTYKFLVQNKKDNISLMIISGSWIEALYLTTTISNLTKNNQDFIQIISNQKTSLETLIGLMDPFQSDQNISEILNDINKIKAIYDKSPDQKLTPDLVKELSTTIEKIRNSIVS